MDLVVETGDHRLMNLHRKNSTVFSWGELEFIDDSFLPAMC